MMHITLLPSGEVFDTDGSADLLTAGLQQRVGIPYGCRSGTCGACKATLVTGRTAPLSDQNKANGTLLEHEILLCRSRALSDLQLQIRSTAFRDPASVVSCRAEVAHIVRLTPDIIELGLQLDSDQMRYRAGQYLDILADARVDGRVGAQNQRKSFSIANPDDGSGRITLHIRHVNPVGFTGHVFNRLKVGDVLAVQGPFGDCVLEPADLPQHTQAMCGRPIIFVVSGTGFAPIKAILQESLAALQARPVFLYWGARHWQDLYHQDLLRTWQQRFSHFRYIPVVSVQGEAQLATRVSGTVPVPRKGLVHQAVLDDFVSLAEHDVIACGNPLMVEAARRDFMRMRDLPATSYRADAFVTAVARDDRVPAEFVAIEFVYADRSVVTLHAEQGATLLKTLLQQHVPIMSVCGGKGVCGTCLVLPLDNRGHLLPEPHQSEAELLGCLGDIAPGARLACQIRIASNLKGARFQLTSI